MPSKTRPPKASATRNLEAVPHSITAAGKGTLYISGGHEDRKGDKPILREIAETVGNGTLVVATIASEEPESLWKEYQRAFGELGVRALKHLHVQSREEAASDEVLELVRSARGFFFTGGDQARITSRIGGTLVCDEIRTLFQRGGVLAGTSSGASVMSETMITGGNGEQSHRIDATVQMAPGLGIVNGMIIDQHFAERGRIGRLLGAVAHNPRILGLGIDEDTAVVLEGSTMRVTGAGAVYVVDGRAMSHTNISESEPDCTMSVFDMRLHVLAADDRFDLVKRTPMPPPPAVESKKRKKVS